MNPKENIHPELLRRVEKMIELAKAAGFDLRVVSGYRSHAEQDKLFRKHPKVTNARGGQSWHNFGLACDMAPFIGGKVCYDEKLFDWSNIGKWAAACGLEWGGSWRRFKDRPHVQLIAGFKNTTAAEKIFISGGNKLSAVWDYVSKHVSTEPAIKPKAEKPDEKINDLGKVQEIIENAVLPEASENSNQTEKPQFNIPGLSVNDFIKPVTDSVGTVAETTKETFDDGKKQVEKATTEVTNTFSPQNIPAFIPQFGLKNWLLGLIPAGGFLSTILAYIQNAPPMVVFALGFFSGITAYGFLQLLMKHREKVIDFLMTCYRSISNPNAHNLIPTNAAKTLGTTIFGSLLGSRAQTLTEALTPKVPATESDT
jgi:hypothetical protein